MFEANLVAKNGGTGKVHRFDEGKLPVVQNEPGGDGHGGAVMGRPQRGELIAAVTGNLSGELLSASLRVSCQCRSVLTTFIHVCCCRTPDIDA